MKKSKIKRTKTDLGKHISMVIPMIEEMTENNLVPLCLIAFSVDTKDKKKLVSGRFITISDDFDATVLELCKQLVKSKAEHRTEP